MASTDYDTTKDCLTSWIIHAENSGLPRFVSVARTMNKWISSILNSFTTPYTNSYTESINNKIKVFKRNAMAIVTLSNSEAEFYICVTHKNN